MLDALKGMNLNDWKFVFVGPVVENFSLDIENFYKANPDLKSNVTFTGEITDRHELFSWYKRAKCFCLTSPREGFPLCLCEALYFGCEIVSTPIDALPDFTNNGEFGYQIQNAQELNALLQKFVDGQIDPSCNMEKIIAHSKRFYLTEICGKLNDLLSVQT